MGEGPGGERSFVDTDIFLYAIQGHPRFGETSEAILRRIDREEEAVISSVTLAEICWWLERHGTVKEMEEKLKLVLSIFNLRVVPVDHKDFLKGARIIGELGIDFNDCLTLAVMKRLGISRIYSNDSDFDGLDGIDRSFG